MSGPQTVCAGCGDPAPLHKPICDDCQRFFDSGDWRKLALPSCALCVAGLRKNALGQHVTARGGYAGPCDAPETRGTSEGHPPSEPASIPESG